MPGGPPLEGPKGEKLPEPPEGEGATPEAANPETEISPHIEVGRNVCQTKGNTIQVSQPQYSAGQSGKQRRHCTTLITQVCLSHTVTQCKATALPKRWKVILY